GAEGRQQLSQEGGEAALLAAARLADPVPASVVGEEEAVGTTLLQEVEDQIDVFFEGPSADAVELDPGTPAGDLSVEAPVRLTVRVHHDEPPEVHSFFRGQ